MLVEVSLQILIVTLDHDFLSTSEKETIEPNLHENLFINYLSRIHREEDFKFILKGFTRLLNNPLQQTYLPNSVKRISFHQELLVLFWKFCDYNKKFMFYVLKSSDVLDILVPILYHLNDSRSDQAKIGLIHIGVFILLLLSGERNFGVRLNKPYNASTPMDLPIFTGTHADLLIIVFHKLITAGNQRLQPLFDCLLTIIVNVSPYLKTLSMVSANKLLHLLEAFSTPWFLFSTPLNHHLVFFLLEIFNNIIQYQFDGNSNLIYTIIRKRNIFHALSNLPVDYYTIQKSLIKQASRSSLSSSSSSSSSSSKKINTSTPSIKNLAFNSITSSFETVSINANCSKNEEMECKKIEIDFSSSETNVNVSLAKTPIIEKMTEKTHPNSYQDKNYQDNQANQEESSNRQSSISNSSNASEPQQPTPEWINSWKQKLPLQTIMRMLQVKLHNLNCRND